MGALMIWQTVSWIFWVTGSSILLHHSRTLFSRGECRGVVVYCGQLQALFGVASISIRDTEADAVDVALSVVEM